MHADHNGVTGALIITVAQPDNFIDLLGLQILTWSCMAY